MIIIDDEVLHKTGRHMEKANYHRSGKTKRNEWGHCMVDALYVGANTHFPIDINSYLRKPNTDREHPFKTKREIALDILELNKILPQIKEPKPQVDKQEEKISSKNLEQELKDIREKLERLSI